MNGRLLLAVVLVASVAVLDAQPTRALETFDKAWTIIRDTHFDVTMNGVDWEAVRTELRPRAAEAGTDSELRAVIREMLGKLGQSHFALIPSTADASTGGRLDLSAGPGFDFRLVGNVLLVTRVVDIETKTAIQRFCKRRTLTEQFARFVDEVQQELCVSRVKTARLEIGW